VTYVRTVLRKSSDSEGWSALLEADRLDLSFEDLVVHAEEPVRGLFTDEDREIASRSLGSLQAEVDRRRDASEALALEHDRSIVSRVAARRRDEGKPWTPEIEARMLADRAARRAGG
jgi:hypothetical protein